jgi:hypothetical protein
VAGAGCGPLSALAYHLFATLDLFHKFSIPLDVFANFFSRVERGYKVARTPAHASRATPCLCAHRALHRQANPYHNALHATDVMQSVFVLLMMPSLSQRLSPLDVFAGAPPSLVRCAQCSAVPWKLSARRAALVAAAVHDLGHPGTTNAFQIATNSPLGAPCLLARPPAFPLALTGGGAAVRYNDRSVLENFHLAEAFDVLKDPACDIFVGLDKETKKVRSAAALVPSRAEGPLTPSTDGARGHHRDGAGHRYAGAPARPTLRLAQTRAHGSCTCPSCRSWRPCGPSSPTGTRCRPPTTTTTTSHACVTPACSQTPGPRTRADTLLFLKAAVHCADVANPAKVRVRGPASRARAHSLSAPAQPRELYLKWVDLVYEEFYLQGDRELALGLPISPLMDRRGADRVNVAKGQLGFIDFFIAPLFEMWTGFVPESRPCYAHVVANRCGAGDARKRGVMTRGGAGPTLTPSPAAAGSPAARDADSDARLSSVRRSTSIH